MNEQEATEHFHKATELAADIIMKQVKTEFASTVPDFEILNQVCKTTVGSAILDFAEQFSNKTGVAHCEHGTIEGFYCEVCGDV